MRLSYGALDDIVSDDENVNELSPMSTQLPRRMKHNKRWSVIEKLQDRHYCRIRNCDDCQRIMSFKFLLSIMMLIAFLILAYSVASTLFFSALDTSRYDYIVVGSGPAGSLLSRKLSDYSALNVLLLEAGTATQYSLGGKDYFGGPATRFDIPLLWPTVTEDENFRWDINTEHVVEEYADEAPVWSLAKGFGGCGVHNAMIYVRALPDDIVRWNISGWSWEKVLEKYKLLENYLVKDTPSMNTVARVNGAGHGKDMGTKYGNRYARETVELDSQIDTAANKGELGTHVGNKVPHMKQWEFDDSAHSGFNMWLKKCEGQCLRNERQMLGGDVHNGSNTNGTDAHLRESCSGCKAGDYSKYRYMQHIMESRRLRMSARLRGSLGNERVVGGLVNSNKHYETPFLRNGTPITRYAPHTGASSARVLEVSVDALTSDFNADIHSRNPSSNRIVVDTNHVYDPLSATFVDASLGVGIPYTKDFNQYDASNNTGASSALKWLSSSRIGVGNYHFNIANGTRQSVAHVLLGKLIHNNPNATVTTTTTTTINSAIVPTPGSALKPETPQPPPSTQFVIDKNTDSNLPRGLLKIQLGATVTRILFDETNAASGSVGNNLKEKALKRAIGVEYEVDGVLKTAYLRQPALKSSIISDFRSIILTAGAIMTPKILMNSGIGPENVLKAANIPVTVDSPLVGRGLKDHPSVGMVYKIDPKKLPHSYPNGYMMPRNYVEYMRRLKKSLHNAYMNDWTGHGNEKEHTQKTHHREMKNKLHSYKAFDDFDSGFGLLGSPGFSTGIFLRSPYATQMELESVAGKDVPDIQITMFPSVTEPSFIKNRKKQEVVDDYSDMDLSIDTNATDLDSIDTGYIDVLVTIALLNPQGAYKVVIDPNVPISAPPTIQYDNSLGNAAENTKATSNKHYVEGSKYLTALDILRLEWGILRVREIFNQSPLREVVVDEVSPGNAIESDKQGDNSSVGQNEVKLLPGGLFQWIVSNHYPNSHWTGTARMGNTLTDLHTNDLGTGTSVVDEKLKVRGTSNLYTADASVMPFIPNGNVHSTVTVVASMAAEFLLEQYQFILTLL